jgi:hypothetical protein
MKRQTDPTVTSRNYTYGCVTGRIAPILNEDKAHNQLWLANRLWNVLVTIERIRVERYRRVMYNEDPARAEAISKEFKETREAIKAARQKTRNRKGAKATTDPLQQRINLLAAERKDVIERLKTTEEQHHEEHKAELEREKQINSKRITRARQAASHMGLFWGTYNNIIQRADAGRKLGDLQYRRFSGDGTVTTQIMGGMTVGAMQGGHGFFQIDPPTENQKWRYARLRIGSSADRSPVWLEVPTIYHRDLPADAMIKSVSATRRTVAGKVRWSLTITCTMPKPEQKNGTRVMALDLCYRLMPTGVRAGYWHDGERGGEILIPAADIKQFRKVQSRRSKCDQQRDEAIPMLAAWLSGKILDDEWKKRSGYMMQWKSSDRLARLVRWWADNRLEQDGEIFAAAVEWRKRYLHLSNWWRNLSEQMTLRVREQYRVFAAQKAKEYDVLLIEEFDLTQVIEKPQAESDELKPMNSYRRVVSPSLLRGALVNVFMREGLRVEKINAVDSTQECHLCGDVTPWDAADNVMHRCTNGHLWDQDYNACVNLLKRWRLASGKVVAAIAG